MAKLRGYGTKGRVYPAGDEVEWDDLPTLQPALTKRRNPREHITLALG